METLVYARIKNWYLSKSTNRLVGFVSNDMDGDSFHTYRTVTSPVTELNEKGGYATTRTTHYLLMNQLGE